jgi:molecular chaperone HscA
MMSQSELPIQSADALFQIAEPGQSRASKTERVSGLAIGIDLGTTHSLVAIAPAGAPPKAIPDVDGQTLLASVVSYAHEEPVVGDRARDDFASHPEKVFVSVKRFMGRAPRDVSFDHPWQIAQPESNVLRFSIAPDRQVSPVQISAEILKDLRKRVESMLGEPVRGAVITVPAYFDDAQRQATKDAGRLAGLEVMRLLAEPTAAALAYGLDRNSQGLFAVYDLGGGTFDISILRLKGGVFQVLATGGDTALGGDDFDRTIVKRMCAAANLSSPSPAQMQALAYAARRLKERLSDDASASADVPSCDLSGFALERGDFENDIEPLIRQTIATCRRALKDAEVGAHELDGVVLVGGSTRVPSVRRQVAKFFGREPLGEIDPDKVVAYGAAISADLLSGHAREGVTLLDVVPLSLGIETMGGIVEKIIPRNSTIPISARQTFTNYSELQTAMSITVVQGERELAKDCRELAHFELQGIPRLPPSMARVEVTFQLDADGLLEVSAIEKMTGVKQTVAVKPSYGLSAEQIDALVEESHVHASEDYAARNLAEARVELGRVALAVKTALAEVGEVAALISAVERARLEAMVREADAAMADPKANVERLRDTTRLLETQSEPFARRRMERALKSGMDGMSLAEIENTLARSEAEDSPDMPAFKPHH